jgi:hypothetical protein
METNRQEEYLRGIQKRLDVLISLSIDKELKEDKSLTKKVAINKLAAFGLKYTEIAGILGKSPSYIASELTQARKGGAKK